jgi:predicted transcriptional regulator
VIGEEQISLSASAFVSDAIFFMKRNNIRRIVVRDGDKIYGVFSVDEALHHILDNTTDVRLVDAKKKKPIMEESLDLKRIVKRMVEENSDFVLVGNKIITEKSVVSMFDWKDVKERVSDISNEGITLPPYTKLFTAIEIMIKRGIRHLIIADKKPIGILSSRDIVFSYGQVSLSTEISNFIQPSLVSVPCYLEVREAVNLMLSRNVGTIITTNSSVKLFTLRDLIKVISKYL